MKAYTTRVGEGALPTEDRQFTERLHGLGREFGATTGRKRRCGWFDAVATRYATMINGIDEIAITNLDGLDDIDPIRGESTQCLLNLSTRGGRVTGLQLHRQHNLPPLNQSFSQGLRQSVVVPAPVQIVHSFRNGLRNVRRQCLGRVRMRSIVHAYGGAIAEIAAAGGRAIAVRR